MDSTIPEETLVVAFLISAANSLVLAGDCIYLLITNPLDKHASTRTTVYRRLLISLFLCCGCAISMALAFRHFEDDATKIPLVFTIVSVMLAEV
jgi:hypothetical protein